MLILIGVTINVALNGGLFKNAKNAGKGTEEKAILEEIISMSRLDESGDIDVNSVIAKINEKYGSNATKSGDIVTIVGKQGTYKYKVTDKEICIAKDEEPKPYTLYLTDLEPFAESMGINVDEDVIKNGKLGIMVFDTPSFGLFPGFVYYDNEPTQIEFGFVFILAIAFNNAHMYDSLTITVNGEEVTYNNAITRSALNQGADSELMAYIKDNKFIWLSTEHANSGYALNENQVVTEYTKCDEALVFTKGTYKTPESLNYDVYKKNLEDNSKVVGDYLIALNPTNTKLYKGAVVYDEAYIGDGIPCTDLPLYQEVYPCTLLTTFEASMSGGGTKTFNNVIMSSKHMSDGSLKDGGEPLGYLNGNTFVELTCEYDSSNRDENGYPVEYTKLEESGNVYTK